MPGPQQCPKCGAANQPTARFCSQCSQPLGAQSAPAAHNATQRACSNCGNVMPANAQFCNQCGQRFVTPSTPIAAPTPASAPVSAPVSAPALGAGSRTGRLTVSALLAGRYLVERKLGEGGMGAVYLVCDQRLGGKRLALKEMSDQGIVDPAERQAALVAFAQEAQMLGGLDHPNLPKVSDYFEENGNQYLVMDYVQGETLEKRLERIAGPLSEPVVRKYAEQLCDVLGYLHQRQPPIIFRDLKPTNIMVQADERLKLIDFGIARHFKPGKSKDTQAMGTPGYAAPEQYGKGQSDERTDIYALGATMHHMLTGCDPSQQPFQFASPRSLNPGLSRSIDQAVMKAVELDPTQRWQTVRDLRNWLNKATGQVNSGPATFVSTAYPTQAAAARVATQVALPPSPQPVNPPTAQPQAGWYGGLPAPGQPLRVPAPQSLPLPGMVPYIPPMPPGLLGQQYASYGARVLAYLIDGFLLTVLYMFVAAFVGALLFSGSSYAVGLSGISFLLLIACAVLYMVWPTAKGGQTLGKKMMGIRVVDDTGDVPGWGKSLVRYLIGFPVEALFFYIGLIWPLFDAKKQAWHDKIASTYVVQK